MSQPRSERLRSHDATSPADTLDHWLWCLRCERFFQVRHLGLTPWRLEACPFDDCAGEGIDRDIFMWDDWRQLGDPRWPISDSELVFGMRSPEIASLSWAANFEHAADLIDDFERSFEFRALKASGTAHWARSLVHTLWWWGMSLEFVDPDYLAATLDDFPRGVSCRPGDVGAITGELEALFRFVARAYRWPLAGACAEHLARHATARDLRRSIRRVHRAARRISTISWA